MIKYYFFILISYIILSPNFIHVEREKEIDREKERERVIFLLFIFVIRSNIVLKGFCHLVFKQT